MNSKQYRACLRRGSKLRVAEMERLNAQALEVLVNEHKVKLVAFPRI
jgi:hypothetical protein